MNRPQAAVPVREEVEASARRAAARAGAGDASVATGAEAEAEAEAEWEGGDTSDEDEPENRRGIPKVQPDGRALGHIHLPPQPVQPRFTGRFSHVPAEGGVYVVPATEAPAYPMPTMAELVDTAGWLDRHTGRGAPAAPLYLTGLRIVDDPAPEFDRKAPGFWCSAAGQAQLVAASTAPKPSELDPTAAQCVVYLNALTETGGAICMRVTGYQPFLMLRVPRPKNMTNAAYDAEVAAVCRSVMSQSYSQYLGGSYKTSHRAILSASVDKKFSGRIFEATCDGSRKTYQYVVVRFASPMARRKFSSSVTYSGGIKVWSREMERNVTKHRGVCVAYGSNAIDLEQLFVLEHGCYFERWFMGTHLRASPKQFSNMDGDVLLNITDIHPDHGSRHWPEGFIHDKFPPRRTVAKDGEMFGSVSHRNVQTATSAVANPKIADDVNFSNGHDYYWVGEVPPGFPATVKRVDSETGEVTEGPLRVGEPFLRVNVVINPAGDITPIPGVWIICCANEQQLLNVERDLDIMWMRTEVQTGYNTDGFDWPYWARRATRLHAKRFFYMDALLAVPVEAQFRAARINAKVGKANQGDGGEEFRFRPFGLTLLDLLSWAKRNLKLADYKLDTVSKSAFEGKAQKFDVTFRHINAAWDTRHPDDLAKIVGYCMQDTNLVAQLDAKFGVTATLMNFARYSYTPLAIFNQTGVGVKCRNVFLHFAQQLDIVLDGLGVTAEYTIDPEKMAHAEFWHKLGWDPEVVTEDHPLLVSRRVLPTDTKKVEKQKTTLLRGGTVLEPPGDQLYKVDSPESDQWVAGQDFASMYPSITIGYGISPDLFIRRDDLQDCIDAGVAVNATESRVTFDHKHYYAATDRRRPGFVGIMPKAEMELWQARNTAKDKMKAASKRGDNFWAKNYDRQQKAIKIVMNSLFGFLGSGGTCFGSWQTADAITTKGGIMARQCIELCRSKGDVVVYGDTDSVFVTHPGVPAKEAWALMSQREKELTALFPERPLPRVGIYMEFEKIYGLLVFKQDTQKRYSGRYCERECDWNAFLAGEQDLPNKENKGDSSIKRDSCLLLRNTVKAVDAEIFSIHGKIENGVAMIQEMLRKLVDDEHPLEHYVMTHRLKGAGAYAQDKTPPAHVVVAFAMHRAAPGSEPKVGDRARLIVAQHADPNRALCSEDADEPVKQLSANLVASLEGQTAGQIAKKKTLKARELSEFQADPAAHRVDRLYYLTNALMKPLLSKYGKLFEIRGLRLQDVFDAAIMLLELQKKGTAETVLNYRERRALTQLPHRHDVCALPCHLPARVPIFFLDTGEGGGWGGPIPPELQALLDKQATEERAKQATKDKQAAKRALREKAAAEGVTVEVLEARRAMKSMEKFLRPIPAASSSSSAKTARKRPPPSGAVSAPPAKAKAKAPRSAAAAAAAAAGTKKKQQRKRPAAPRGIEAFLVPPPPTKKRA